MRIQYCRDLISDSITVCREQGIVTLSAVILAFLASFIIYPYYHFVSGYERICDYDTSKIRLIKIDPQKIKYRAIKRHKYIELSGEHGVVGTMHGNWDLCRRPICPSQTYRKHKEKSGFYKKSSNKVDYLICSLQSQGYVPQWNLNDRTVSIQGLELYDEPWLAVGRKNEPIRWERGIHRIIAAQILGLDYIYAYVVLVHPEADYESFIEEYHIDNQ